MARPTPTSQVSVGELVLGLIVEQPGNGYELSQRLGERFGSAGFSGPSARMALKGLEKQGYVLRVEGLYQATASGVERFHRWLFASTRLPPVREELLVRVAFCEPRDLPRLIEIVGEAELACVARLEELNARLREEERASQLQGWRKRMSVVMTAGDAAWWDGRIKWLQGFRAYLRREWQRHEAEQLRAAQRLPR